MGMSTHVVGFRPPDELWKKHQRIWNACEAADVEVPKETLTFFNYDAPDDAGVEVELEEDACCAEFNDSGRAGFEIDLSKLPKDVKIIRFFNSW